MEDHIPSLLWPSLAIAPVSLRAKAEVLPAATKHRPPPRDLDRGLSSCHFSTCLCFSAAPVWTCQLCSHLRPCPGCIFRLKDPGRISAWWIPFLPHTSNGMPSSQWERSIPWPVVCYCPPLLFSLHWLPFSLFCRTNHLVINYAVYWLMLLIVYGLALPITVWILWGQGSLLIWFTRVFQPSQIAGDIKYILENYLLNEQMDWM